MYVGTSYLSCDFRSPDTRIVSPFETRKLEVQCPIGSTLVEIMLKKKSNVCVAADVTKSHELLALAKSLGPHIAVLKTHSDAVADWSEETQNELTRLAKEQEFLIMEDR